MLKKYFKIGAIFVVTIMLILLCIYYFVMILPTNSIMSKAEKILKCELIADETDTLSRYNRGWLSEKPSTIKLSLRRTWVWHNGKTGHMDILYTACYYDGDGNLISGSWNIDSKWYIEKQNGKWIVTRIYELA